VDAVALLIATQPDRSARIEASLTNRSWRVVAEQHPQQALERLRAGGWSAVFCDEYLRGASPGGFLAWARRIAPGLPFYQFATDPDAPQRAFATPDAVLPFPPDPVRLPPAPVTGAASEAADGAQVPLQGDLDTMPLGGILDMMAVAQQSAVVRVSGGTQGELVLDRGVLQHAAAGDEALGLRAVAELITLKEGSFRVESYRPPRKRTLSLPTATALTEAAKLADELDRDRTLVARVRHALPAARAVAAGYPPSPGAIVGEGPMREAFDTACRLLEANRPQVGRFSHLCLEPEEGALAIVMYGEGRLLVATGDRGTSLRLLAALSAAVRGAPA
jgi:hypothetical protein